MNLLFRKCYFSVLWFIGGITQVDGEYGRHEVFEAVKAVVDGHFVRPNVKIKGRRAPARRPA